MFKRLRLRLTVVCALSTGLVLAAMAGSGFYFSASQLRAQAEESFASNLNTVFFYLHSQGVVSHSWLAQTEKADGLVIAISSGGDRLMYNDGDPRRQALTALALETARELYGFDPREAVPGILPEYVDFLLEYQGVRYRAAVASVPGVGGNLEAVILKDRTSELGQRARLGFLYALCVLLGELCLLAFAWLFTGRAVKPVEESRQRQSEFISAASHELRSPLTVMRASAETLRRSPTKRVPELAGIIEEECGRLALLTEDMLRLASSDSHSWTINPTLVEPESLIFWGEERFQPLARQRGVTLEISLPREPLPKLLWDGERIRQVLSLLLDNALAYTPEGGRVELSLRLQRRRVLLTVADSGPGIPNGEKEAVFRRFYQGDSSRTDKEHYGLGLAIGREIAALHKGTLTVEDSPLGGAAFVLSLPVRRG